MKRARWLIFGVMTLLVVGATVVGAAPRPGTEAACWADPDRVPSGESYEIWGVGLPTKTALNVFVTDSSGTVGFPVGERPSGILDGVYWNAGEPGTAKLEITGPTRPNTKVYATCWMEVTGD